MVLVLNRTYFPEGTQGVLEWNGTLICYTIELPWLENQRRISCIPEGEYILQKRFSPKLKWHFLLMNVPGRDLILIHPANDAKLELLGCIAPVTVHTGIGKGSAMNIVDRAIAPTPKFFRILRSIGLVLLAISGTIIAAPVALPVALVSVAGYVAVAGGVISAVSQLTNPLAPEDSETLKQVQGDKRVQVDDPEINSG